MFLFFSFLTATYISFLSHPNLYLSYHKTSHEISVYAKEHISGRDSYCYHPVISHVDDTHIQIWLCGSKLCFNQARNMMDRCIHQIFPDVFQINFNSVLNAYQLKMNGKCLRLNSRYRVELDECTPDDNEDTLLLIRKVEDLPEDEKEYERNMVMSEKTIKYKEDAYYKLKSLKSH